MRLQCFDGRMRIGVIPVLLVHADYTQIPEVLQDLRESRDFSAQISLDCGKGPGMFLAQAAVDV